MNWFVAGLIAVSFLTAYNFISKLFSSKISSLYAIPFVAIGVLVAALVSYVLTRTIHFENLVFSKNGALLAMLGGLLWGLSGIFYFLMFAKGAPLSVGLPFVVGSITIMGTILGVLFLREPLATMKIAGTISLFVGLVLLSRA